MRHSMSKDTAFNAETTPRHTFLCSDSQCLPPGDPRILCAKHGSPITGKSFIDHFTVVDLVPQPSSECEAKVDLVLIQASFTLLWKLSLTNTNYHKNREVCIETGSPPASLPSITVKWPINYDLIALNICYSAQKPR